MFIRPKHIGTTYHSEKNCDNTKKALKKDRYKHNY